MPSKAPPSPVPKTATGAAGELHQPPAAGGAVLTTNQALPVADNQNSLRAGRSGRSTGAHGYFELIKSLAKYTRAKVLTAVGVKIPVVARFSTVAGVISAASHAAFVTAASTRQWDREPEVLTLP